MEGESVGGEVTDEDQMVSMFSGSNSWFLYALFPGINSWLMVLERSCWIIIVK